ncbi:MAG: hypothetical protein E7311_03980 [Clostridiales bacterium]|nr:hypothetical protein [Clostridiales bacterium]
MNWKKAVISLVLSVICTLLMMYGLSKHIQLHGGMFLFVLFIFVMFAVIFTSSYDIIKKKNVKLNIWLTLEGINGIILILSFSSIVAKEKGLMKIATPYPIAITSLILFFIISAVCMKLEQKMKESNK